MATTATLSWQPLYLHKHRRPPLRRRHAATVRAFRRGDLDRFARRVTSGEAWRDAWRSANDGFELLVFEAKKTAERIDRQYSVSRRLNSAARAATDRAREMDREFEISLRWRTFSMDFSRNWPRVCTSCLTIYTINARNSINFLQLTEIFLLVFSWQMFSSISVLFCAGMISEKQSVHHLDWIFTVFSVTYTFRSPLLLQYRKQLNDFLNTPLGRSFAVSITHLCCFLNKFFIMILIVKLIVRS